MQVPFTKVPNSAIDDLRLNAYDLAVFCVLLRFNPSFPSYPKIMKLLLVSRETVWKSLKKLEEYGYIVKLRRRGRSTVYAFKPSVIGNRLVRQANWGSSPGRLGVVRQANCNKTNHKKNLKSEERIFNSHGNKQLGSGMPPGVKKFLRDKGIMKSMEDKDKK